jgi:thiol:disulfide interchange protein
MKYLSWLILSLSVVFSSFAQVKNHAQWTYTYAPQNPKIGDVVEVTFTATLDEGWYIYSSQLKVEGPEPTTFTFNKNKAAQVVGSIVPVGFKEHFEEVWEGNVAIAYKKAVFKQKVKILGDNPTLQGNIKYQTCSDQCTQGEHDFTLNIKTAKVLSSALKVATIQDSSLKNSDIVSREQKTVNQKSDTVVSNRKSEIVNSKSDTSSLWSFLLTCFLGGLASIFMPCIYPIMPMTVNYFTKQAGGKGKIMLYGLFIVLIYTFFGFLVSLIGGADAANFISTHWLPNLIFFLVFIAFGLSFLGAFEIVLPSSFVNKVDQQADQGGLIGIFFMALTLVVVSFSCTGPIASSLLIEAARGQQVIRPILGMAFYALPFALVFSGLALFPSLLKGLPKSGGWLNEFKVVFGMLELALALKFLSNIDLAYHWDSLDREIFLAIWIVIFALIGFYILGKIRMDKDSVVEKVGIQRLLYVIATFSFVMYMIPGMFGAPLRGLSGWLPPEQTQDFYLTNNGTGTANIEPSNDKIRLPEGLEGYSNYEKALTESKKTGKPIFIDFTGKNCANCRKMEANVWPDPKILTRLKNDYIIVSLYVDDKTELPENERYISKYDNKQKTTVGEKNADLQITKFNNNAQPYYCLVNADGTLLAKPVGYTGVDEFAAFLDLGLKGENK